MDYADKRKSERELKQRLTNMRKPLRPKTYGEQSRARKKKRERENALDRLRRAQEPYKKGKGLMVTLHRYIPPSEDAEK